MNFIYIDSSSEFLKCMNADGRGLGFLRSKQSNMLQLAISFGSIDIHPINHTMSLTIP